MREVCLPLLIVAVSLALAIYAAALAPQSNQFTVTGSVFFNWSNGAIRIVSGYNGLTVSIRNSSTTIQPMYFQTSSYAVSSYPNYTSSAALLCMGTGGSSGTKFLLQNSTQSYTNTTTLNLGQSMYFYFSPYTYCPPGLYNGTVTVENASNLSDNVNITATIIVPISMDNTLMDGTKTGSFKGTLSSGYHSYYFWTNATSNAKAVTINLTGLTADLDLFLLDSSGVVLGSSVSSGTSTESILYTSLPTNPQLWEIRIGNSSSSYQGYIYFSSLSISNSSLSLGTIGLNNTYNTTFTLTNLANSTIDSVSESIEIYKVLQWTNLDGSAGFQFLVPTFAQKIEAIVTWKNETGKNMSDWDMNLYDANGVLRGTSNSTSQVAIGSNASAKEIISYTGSVTTSNDGLWNLSVYNGSSTGSLCSYNLTIMIWFPRSEWIYTNWTTSTFNNTGLTNASRTVNVSITVPETRVLDGQYAVNLYYSNGSGSVFIAPVNFSLKAGTLLVGGNLTDTTYRWEDNVGINRTGIHARQLSIEVNNTGSYPVNYSGQSSGSLNLTTNESKFLNFTVDWPNNPIAANANTSVELSVTIDTTVTGNTQGVYRGWIAFNSTNVTTTTSSYPYNLFNLTLEINLSNQLTVNITQVSPTQILNNSQSNNLTITAVVMLANGSVISNNGIMTSSNFTSARLTERTLTSYYTAASSVGDADSATCGGGVCRVNATMPSGMTGGNYSVSLQVSHSLGGVVMNGSSSYNSVLVNETGLFVSSEAGSDLGIMNEGTSKYVKFYVTNHGGFPANSANLYFYVPSGCPVTATTYDQGCSATESGATFTTTIGANGTMCWYRWRLTSSNITSDKSCSGLEVRVLDKKTFSNATGMSLFVNNIEPTSSTPSGTSGSSCSSSSDCAWNYRCSGSSCIIIECSDEDKHIVDHECVSYRQAVEALEYNNLSILLGGSDEDMVMVKNTGDKTVRAKLDVVSVEGITYKIETSSYSASNDCPLTPNSYCYFKVSFNVSTNATLGKHALFYKAYVSDKPSTNILSPFYITVLATEERKTHITSTYVQYLGAFEEFKEKLGILRLSGIDPANLSKVELLLNETETGLANAKAAMDNEEFAEAEELLNNVNSTFSRITGMFASMGVENMGSGLLGMPTSTWLLIIGVGVAVVAGGLLIYMLMPPKGYKATFKDYYSKNTDVRGRISDSIKKITPKKGDKYKYINANKKEDKYKYKYNP